MQMNKLVAFGVLPWVGLIYGVLWQPGGLQAETAEAPAAEASATPAPAAPPAPAPVTPPAPAPAAPAAGAGTYVEDFLGYRLDIQTKIEKIWFDYLETYGRQLKRGRVVFRYHVNPDGKITLVEPAPGKAAPAVVALAHRSILEANKQMVPFPATVKQKHASGYFNSIAFTVK